jgi:uncharacterized protein (UPF0276 family)
MDLPWGGDTGFVRDPSGADHVAERVHRFLAQPPGSALDWTHVFFSVQPRDRAVPRSARYQAGWDDAVRAIPPFATRALHTTALDLGAARPKSRGALIGLVNDLVARHDFRWVNEDLGLWSLGGQPLPYPLPPYLTDAGLAASIDNVRACQRELDVPLLVEFPGFSRGVSLPIGGWDAYDYFAVVARESEAPVTLDVGHLLSWRWLVGHRGAALFDGLDRLPLAHCFEIHLSGCEIRGEDFFDAHHGVLLDAQHVLLHRLLALCPNVRAVTYEDPVIDADGQLSASCRPSLERLVNQVAPWVDADPGVAERLLCPTPESRRKAWDVRGADVGLLALDDTLSRLVYDADARASRRAARMPLWSLDDDELDDLADLVVTRLLERKHVGTGTLEDAFPEVFAGRDAQQIARRFLSAEGRSVTHGMCEPRGVTLEEAFALFAIREGLADAGVVQTRMAKVVARAVAVAGEPAFALPTIFDAVPGGIAAVLPTEPPTLVAVLNGQIVEGPITALLADLIAGAALSSVALRHDVPLEVVAQTAMELMRRGLRREGGAAMAAE